MQTLYKGTYGSEFKLEGKNINSITLYDDKGNTYSCNDLRKEDGKEDVEQIEVLHILRHSKSFRKPETEQEFIKKNMQKKINFSYISKEKTWYDKNEKLELYLYIDNEFLKIVDIKKRVEVGLNDYDFSKSYSYYTDITLDIDGQIAKNTSCDKYEVVAQEELQEHAKKIFDEVVRVSYIQESEFNRIFNQYKLVRRDTPLLTK